MDSASGPLKAQAQIRIVGKGMSVPGSQVGLNVGTAAYLCLRPNKSAPFHTYGLASFLDASGHSGSIVFGWVKTDWLYIPDSAFDALRIKNINGNGYKLDVQVKGTLLRSGKTDVEISLIDQQGQGIAVAESYDVPSRGYQAAGTSVRSQILLMPPNKVPDPAAP